MRISELKNNGAFVATVLVLVVVLLPFGIEEIGEATGLFSFPAKKTVTGWFSSSSTDVRRVSVKMVDWERYRKDLEEFTEWAESRDDVVVSLPLENEVIIVEEEEEKTERRIWSVPVVSCTSADPLGRRKGYVFVSGFDRPLQEGAIIAPSEDMCGYEIVFVGERSVWLRVITETEGDVPMGKVKFPEFTRVEEDSLVRGNRKYVVRDAFSLSSGGCLMIDSFLPPDGIVFKILDGKRKAVASLLCIVIGEKGGR